MSGKNTHCPRHAQHPRLRPLWPLTDEEVVWQAQKGSKDAFTELVLRYGGRLYSFLIQKNVPPPDAEDLLQETFIKVHRNLHRYQARGRFSTWIYTITYRLAISWFRTQSRVQKNHQEEYITENPLDLLEQKEQKQNLWRLVNLLPENQCRALWLRYAEDMSVKQIARVMKKSPANIRIILYRARLNLAARIHQPDNPEKSQSPTTEP